MVGLFHFSRRVIALLLVIETCERSLNGRQQEMGEKCQIKGEKWVSFDMGELWDGQAGGN